MKQFIAIAFLFMILMSVTCREIPTRQVSSSGAINPIDFHSPFAYSSCGGAIADIINQIVIIYGDIYGTQGLNTVIFRAYQVIMVKFAAAGEACSKGLTA
mmetsp:Transcript_22237/g.24725  ORF Transcript_22237/g.24725 Transcript_22237/m.24725 type:complete len:100 (+) Transcript_22237:38-337(+)|eukprot:CAMPEP_0205800004 /NCGR_PEP_ID=MMETSP0205-20121125/1503_1 /ASSEMBLY_ACC=CAM_ASM_000278 /TAXON_ID=36767 /ORGANISM="Euplotes focardii, Strain TN1" /LENGTH=99 /DNA_ID=CAMNT_0053062339 /DNA_START=8 /DNA_END=307 /DNA_ORIENTATION=+